MSTAVYFFARRNDRAAVREVFVKPGDQWPVLSGSKVSTAWRSRPVFRKNGIEETEPVITLPVTGDTRVGMHHHGRRVVLSFACGLTQARVANGILRKKASGKRLPKNVKYQGDGALSLDVMLLQDDPECQLSLLAEKIANFGGTPVVSPTLSGFYRKLIKRFRRAIQPMRRVIQTTNTLSCNLEAIRRVQLDPGDFSSPSIAKGEVVNAVLSGGEYLIEHAGVSVTLRSDEVVSRYNVVGNDSKEAEWVVLHEGLSSAFPELATQYSSMIDRAGITWLAAFQRADVNEGLISPYGYIGALEQGSGKTRVALALALLHSGHSMIVVEAGLLPELLREIDTLGLPESLWSVLRNNGDISSKISITTYSTLRGRADTGKTNAKRWRRKINLLVCDEGSLLANSETQQSRAVRDLSARKLLILDGTPVRNHVRNMLALCVASAGNGVAHQAYGISGRSYVKPEQMISSSQTMRGEDAFYENHVVTQWVTHLYLDSGFQRGGKKEIPRVKNLSLFKSWVSPNIQRRLRKEPDLQIFNNCPPPVYQTNIVDWDPEHFEHYIKVAREFAQWYRRVKAEPGKNLNLITVLARIGAVQRAANSPHVVSDSTMATYSPETSKQREAMASAVEWIGKGRKVILYARSPDVLERMHGTLKREHGIESVLFTGRQSVTKRTLELDSEFRMGGVDLLLSSKVAQRGLNLPEANVVMLTETGWTASEEDQIVYRTQRPSQKREVVVERYHLAGSIDEYCAQMVRWKRAAAAAGLDFGEQIGEAETFKHIDTILENFCTDVEAVAGSREVAA